MKTSNRLSASNLIEAMESRILMAISAPHVVVPPPLAENLLVIISQPRTASQGQTIGQITVEIFDPHGQLATADTSSITMTGDSLSGTTTVAAQGGVAVFSDLKINTTGSEVLSASDGYLASVDTYPIVVTNTVTAGKAFFPLTVTPWSADAKWLKLKLVNSSNGKTVLTKTYYPKHGQAIVVNNLSSFVAGTINVVASDSLGQQETLEQVIVTPAAAHSLSFIAQPRILDSNAIVVVTVIDQYGNVTTDGDVQTLTLHSWLPKGCKSPAPVLTGLTTATVIDGVATFTGLTMDQPGKAHLIARLGSLKPTVSNVFQQGATLNVDPGSSGPVL